MLHIWHNLAVGNCVQADDLDETLNESIQDSVTGRTKAALDARAVAAERAKRKRKDLEDEEEAGVKLAAPQPLPDS